MDRLLPDAVLSPTTAASRGRNNCCCSVVVDHHDRCLSFAAAALAVQEHRRHLERQQCSNNDNNERSTTVLVAYLSWNSIDFALSVLACMQCHRYVPALLNARWTVDEIVAVLANGPYRDRLCICYMLGDLQATAHSVTEKLYARNIFRTIQLLELPTYGMERMEAPRPPPWMAPESWRTPCCSTDTSPPLSRSTAVILFTSGTTSVPKGVELSHAALYVQARAKQQSLYTSSTTLLGSTVPLFHVGGLTNWLAVWMAGGNIVLPSTTTTSTTAGGGASFRPDSVWRSVESQATNTLVVVPTMLFLLQQQQLRANNNNSKTTTFPGVRLILMGGQSASPALLDWTRRVFPAARLVQTYACTEAASSITLYDVTKHQKSGSSTFGVVGKPHVPVAILDNNNNNDTILTAPRKVGTIATRGAHVMNGYWGDTKRVIHANWFRTSDLGCWDEQGRLVFCGRATDSIRTGGETVMALEVEQCILQSGADIRECAVFGIKDDKYGELVCCALVPATTTTPLTIAAVRKICADGGLTPFKHPRKVLNLRQLPRNSSGKVQKFRLAEALNDPRSSRSRL